MDQIAHIRKEYQKQSLEEHHVGNDPITQFSRWWDDALSSDIEEVNAMTLATVDAAGNPSARIVLLKGFDDKGFVFFTNYNSHKGEELVNHPQACLVFFWKELERQVRIKGTVSKISESESDIYYHSRPLESKIGAWASPQSKVIGNRHVIENNFREYQLKFTEANITRPPHWGGFIVKPVMIEFWQGRPSRLHDRLLYSLEENGEWKIERLAP
jgi:pyridoxamine 5'-phosphate oxidase